jgi:tRNA threonylcarbamoyladenosine biosynthesis protein TsaB
MEKGLLAIESSGKRFSVAVFRNGSFVSDYFSTEDQLHESNLAPAVRNLMEACGMMFSDLAAVAIGAGPGSYSGLRIGMALASGLGMASDIPVYPVNTLLNIKHQMSKREPASDFFLSVMPARKDEFFMGLWKRDVEEPIIEPNWVDTQKINQILSSLTTFSCISSNTDESFILSILESKGKVLFQEIYPDARSVGEVAWRQLNELQDLPAMPLEPMYLKPVYFSEKRR